MLFRVPWHWGGFFPHLSGDEYIPCFKKLTDVIIYAGGAKPNDSSTLYAAAYKYNIPCIAIGSAVLDRDAVAAIHEGNALGRTL